MKEQVSYTNRVELRLSRDDAYGKVGIGAHGLSREIGTGCQENDNDGRLRRSFLLTPPFIEL